MRFASPLPRWLALLLSLMSIGAMAAGTPVQAALTWQQSTVSLVADPKSDVLEARFHFTNDGKTAVDIEQVESSCGCTTARLDKRHYEPGESGDIVAQYTVGNHVGKQVKTIAVQSSDTTNWKTLTLEVDIPELLRISPAFVYWKKGESAKPKSLTIELMPNTPFKELTVQSSNKGMQPEIKETMKGRRFELSVTPVGTDQFVFSTLTILLRLSDKETKTYRAFATVKAPEPNVDEEGR